MAERDQQQSKDSQRLKQSQQNPDKDQEKNEQPQSQASQRSQKKQDEESKKDQNTQSQTNKTQQNIQQEAPNNQFQERCKQSQMITCSNKDHSQNPLNLVCLEDSCQFLLDPMCIECVESQKKHKHKEKFRGLKKVLEKLSQDVDSIQKQLQDQNKDSKTWFTQNADAFQELGDKCYQIKDNLLSIMADIMEKGEPYAEVKETRKLLNSIFIEKSDEKLKEQMQDLKNQLDIANEQISIKRADKIVNIQKNVEFYRFRINEEMKIVSEKIELALKSSKAIDYTPMVWVFQKQATASSQYLKEIETGVVFEGSKTTNNEAVYSSEVFDSGRHIFKIKIESFGSKKDHFYIGVTTESQKNLDLLQMPSACVFCNNKTQMSVTPNGFIMGDQIQEGDVLTGYLDFTKNSFELYEQSGKIVYKTSNYYIKGKKHNFFILWNNSSIKIRLIESV